MKTMDYYIGDPHFLPHGDFDNQFSEKIIRLPAMAPFSMSNDLPDVNLLPALGNGFITFGSFNRIEKLNMAVIGLWAQLLNALPTSRMVVGAIPDDGVLADLSQKFKSLGVDLNRIHFKKRTGTHEYMKLHWDVDVCLDTFPYGGSTTTIHALSMGVPTLTVVGKTPIACAGRAILSALKLGDEFVAANESDFVAKGVSLTSRLQDLAALRSSLRERLCRADLMRGEMIAEAFASAARYAWTRWCKNEAAVDFDVVERNGEFEIRC
jgi:predicted O-linked N-acetylglucosamine transferase (SPINDLY family)